MGVEMEEATRAHKAGESLAKAIVEMVCLIYPNRDTAKSFFYGLYQIIIKEMQRRGI